MKRWVPLLVLIVSAPASASQLQLWVKCPDHNAAVGVPCPPYDADGNIIVGGPMSDLAAIKFYAVRFSAPLDTLQLLVNAQGREGDSLAFDVVGIPPGSMGYSWATALDLSGNEGCIGGQYVFAIPDADFEPGLVGDYFGDQNFTQLVYSRIDPVINFDWGTGQAAPGVPLEHFSVRWTGTVRAPLTGSYGFHAYANDTARLQIGATVVLDNLATGDGWQDVRGTITLQAGTEYPIDARMFEKTGSATMKLYWTPPGAPESIIPATAFEH